MWQSKVNAISPPRIPRLPGLPVLRNSQEIAISYKLLIGSEMRITVRSWTHIWTGRVTCSRPRTHSVPWDFSAAEQALDKDARILAAKDRECPSFIDTVAVGTEKRMPLYRTSRDPRHEGRYLAERYDW